MITRTSAAALAALALVLATLSLTPTTSWAATPGMAGASSMDMDCGDFANQAAAQRYFIRIGGPNSDPDALDADGDGVACESNPCPCSTATGGDDEGVSGAPNGPTRPPLQIDRAIVVKVVDGDTVDVRLTKTKRMVRVRVIGIDTPEIYGGRECWGPQASRAARQVLPRGTRVTLTSDRSQDLKDRYGRLLRYVEKDRNRADFGKVQVSRGNARVYVYGGNPFDRTGSYRTSQSQASRANRGLWGNC